MIILHLAPINWGRISGIGTVVPDLIAAQNARDEVDAALVVTARGQVRAPRVSFPVFDRTAALGGHGGLDLPPPFDKPHLVVFHSTYIPAHAAIAGRLRTAGVRYVICPHGGMTRRAQATKWWKKRIGNLLFFNKMVAGAEALQCLTCGEARASSGWNRPIFVVGNGTHFPPQTELAKPGRSAELRLVFMGRLHVDHKGLDMLLDACGMIRGEMLRAGARVELRGPDCQGSTRILQARIARTGVKDVVILDGPVVGETKNELLRQADLFLHPSRTEGHPAAVLEALGYGLPCLLTPATNMADEVAAAGAGWLVQPSAAAIAEGIKSILSGTRGKLQEAGIRARQLALSRYGWPRVADQSVEAYRKYAE